MQRAGGWWALVLSLVASPLMGQGLVGRWSADHDAVNMQTGQAVILHAKVQFFADSTFAASLTSDDGSGELGRTAITRGEFRTITDPWGGRMICVRREDGRTRPHCQPYRINQGHLEWGEIVFGPDLSTQPS